MDICMDIYFPFSQVYLPRSGIPGLCGNFKFLRNCQTVCQSHYTSFHSHQQRMRVPVSLFPRQHLFLSVLLIMAIIACVLFIVVLVSIALMLRTFLCVYWPFVYLLWRNVYLHALPILKLGYLWRHEFKITWSSNTNILCRSMLSSLD